MQNPHGHAVSILERIREIAGPKADKYCDELEVLLGAYMDASLDMDAVIGRPFPLSQCERRLFGILHKNFGKTVYNEALLNAVYFDDMDGGCEESMKVHTHKLRRALDGTKFRIDTEHGVGLRLVPASEPQLGFFSDSLGMKPEQYAKQFGFTDRETAVFCLLCAARGEIVPTQGIVDKFYTSSRRPLTRIRTLITQIRDKLANAPFVLSNERGEGYRLAYSPTIAKQRQTAPVDVAAIVESRRQRARKASNDWYARHKAKPKPESIAA